MDKVQFQAPCNVLAMPSSTTRWLDVNYIIFEQLYVGRKLRGTRRKR